MAEIVSSMVQVHIARCAPGAEPEHLIIRRAPTESVFPGMWQCVTGRINDKEIAVQAALRELSEECGLTPLRFWVLPYISQFYSLQKDAIVSVPVFAALCSIDQMEQLSDEHDAAEWCTLERSNELLVIPAQRDATRLFHTILTNEGASSPFHNVYEIRLPGSRG